MSCVDCQHAPEYHGEFKNLAKKLRDAIKLFDHGRFCPAIEEFEIVAIRLEQIHHDRMGRNVN